jgi:hypothetical protein
MSSIPIRVLAPLLLSTVAHPVLAADGEGGHSLNLLLENDAFAATDRHYTNGLEVAYLTSPREPGGIASWLTGWLPGNEGAELRVGWQVGQDIFTPDDKEASELLPDDRPYAAWLYAGVSVVYSTPGHIDTWSLNLGTVGPDAGGEGLQNGVHEWLGTTEANGWSHQIPDRKGAILVVERKWRALAQTRVLRFGVDLMPHVGFAVGNIQTYANAGLSIRLGNDLDNDFGPPRIRPSLPGSAYFEPHDNWAWYLFVGVDGRYVERNVFIDDHDAASLWSIDKERWTGDTQGGLVITRGDFRMAYTYVFRGREFQQQMSADRFGSLAFTWRF